MGISLTNIFINMILLLLSVIIVYIHNSLFIDIHFLHINV